MKAVIDTSSLFSLVRYYLPFDKEGKLVAFLEESVSAGKIIVLDKVVEECGLLGHGIVLKALPFLSQSNNFTPSVANASNKRLYNMIDNNFTSKGVKRLLQEGAYQFERDKFVNSADFALVMYAYGIKDKEDVVIVTEETGYANDNKPFKKIPGICKELELQTQSLPAFLSENEIIDLSISLLKTTLF